MLSRSISVLTAKGIKRSSAINVIMLGITASLFCLLTTHLALQISRAFDAFIYPPTTFTAAPGTPPIPIPSYGGSALYYDTNANPKYIANEGLWIVAGSITDGFLVSDYFLPGQSTK